MNRDEIIESLRIDNDELAERVRILEVERSKLFDRCLDLKAHLGKEQRLRVKAEIDLEEYKQFDNADLMRLDKALDEVK